MSGLEHRELGAEHEIGHVRLLPTPSEFYYDV
jgi:hypothetical protein